LECDELSSLSLAHTEVPGLSTIVTTEEGAIGEERQDDEEKLVPGGAQVDVCESAERLLTSMGCKKRARAKPLPTPRRPQLLRGRGYAARRGTRHQPPLALLSLAGVEAAPLALLSLAGVEAVYSMKSLTSDLNTSRNVASAGQACQKSHAYHEWPPHEAHDNVTDSSPTRPMVAYPSTASFPSIQYTVTEIRQIASPPGHTYKLNPKTQTTHASPKLQMHRRRETSNRHHYLNPQPSTLQMQQRRETGNRHH
jgi:hypothetical protein